MQEQTLYCERCRSPLGPELLACPEREVGTCPYHLIYSKVLKSNIVGWAFALIGIGMSIIPIVLAIVAKNSISTGGILFALLFGLIFAAIGLFIAVAMRLTLHNPETGQMWEQISIFGVPVLQKMTSALETVTFRAKNARTRRHPASVSALYLLSEHTPRTLKQWTTLATDILYLTILSLVAQEYLELQHTTLFKRRKSEHLFVLRPGTATKGAYTVVEGVLESHIVHAVAEWSQQIDSSITVRNTTYSRKLRHCFVVNDLVYILLDGKWNNPGSRLVTHTIGPDAAHRGLGQTRGGLIKKFDLSKEALPVLRPDYEVVNDTAQQFAAAHPAMAAELHTQIEKAVRSCIDTD